MDCQSCHEREAVVHLTEVSGDKVTTVHLCGRCAAERGIATDAAVTGNPLGSFIAAMAPTAGLPPSPNGESDRCPDCGATLGDIRASGRLGCATCWVTFERPLRKLVKRLHGASLHRGKSYSDPARSETPIERDRYERIRLRQELAEAVEHEEFEIAAELRDRLQELEQEQR